MRVGWSPWVAVKQGINTNFTAANDSSTNECSANECSANEWAAEAILSFVSKEIGIFWDSGFCASSLLTYTSIVSKEHILAYRMISWLVLPIGSMCGAGPTSMCILLFKYVQNSLGRKNIDLKHINVQSQAVLRECEPGYMWNYYLIGQTIEYWTQFANNSRPRQVWFVRWNRGIFQRAMKPFGNVWCLQHLLQNTRDQWNLWCVNQKAE